MATVPSRQQRPKNGGIAGASPRHSGNGSFSARESPGNGAPPPHPRGAWGAGRANCSEVQRSSGDASKPPPQQSSAYTAACRDRWVNITKAMMGEKTEIASINGCVYEGVFHVLTPADPKPGGTRGMYQVCLLYFALLAMLLPSKIERVLNNPVHSHHLFYFVS